MANILLTTLLIIAGFALVVGFLSAILVILVVVLRPKSPEEIAISDEEQSEWIRTHF